jgi:hypothetical protein
MMSLNERFCDFMGVKGTSSFPTLARTGKTRLLPMSRTPYPDSPGRANEIVVEW